MAPKSNGYDGQLSLIFPGTVTPQGLRFDRNLPYKQWAPAGLHLKRLDSWVRFAIGDWMNHGEAIYGEEYAQGVSDAGVSPQVAIKLKGVSGAVPEKIRRLDKLSFGHHELVAPAKYELKEKVMWLERAIENDWGVRTMSEAMNPKAVKEPGDPSSGCECCGASPAPMKSCSKCASVASTALETVGVKGAIELLRRKPSKPQLEMLKWALEYVKEPKFMDEEATIAWQARFEAFKKTVDRAEKKAA